MNSPPCCKLQYIVREGDAAGNGKDPIGGSPEVPRRLQFRIESNPRSMRASLEFRRGKGSEQQKGEQALHALMRSRSAWVFELAVTNLLQYVRVPGLVDLECFPAVGTDDLVHVYASPAFVRIRLSISGTVPFASSVAVR